MDRIENLKKHMRIIEDFPKEGISYKDITTLLDRGDVFRETIDLLTEAVADLDYDMIMGIETRGFIMGAPMSYKTGKGFLMARKAGKLPGDLIAKTYSLEYGEATLEVDRDSVKSGAKILVVDDLIATGGSALAVCELVREAGGEVACALFLTELESLGGRKILEDQGIKVISLLRWDH